MLPDVPQASLYRHLAALVKGGAVDIAEERKVRGTIERVYTLPVTGATLADPSTVTPAEHERYFTAFVSTLLSDFSRYLSRERVDLAADGAGYQQVVLHLDDAELAAFAEGFAALLKPLLANGPREGRTARLFATILMPDDEEGN